MIYEIKPALMNVHDEDCKSRAERIEDVSRLALACHSFDDHYLLSGIRLTEKVIPH
jgi:hypothetical protein